MNRSIYRGSTEKLILFLSVLERDMHVEIIINNSNNWTNTVNINITSKYSNIVMLSCRLLAIFNQLDDRRIHSKKTRED